MQPKQLEYVCEYEDIYWEMLIATVVFDIDEPLLLAKVTVRERVLLLE